MAPTTGTGEKIVVVRSTDKRDFRILKIETRGRGVQAECEDSGASSSKSIRITIDPRLLGANTTSEVKFYTDRLAQPVAKLLVLVTSGSG